jgi:NAD(P)-dependent dehydrogenase (short-subunit alcohol dehydrogenase family)
MGAPLSRDARGYESHFATNHLGHFQLTARLWPALRRANGARVVAVSSWGHRYSDVHLDDPNFEDRDYEPLSAYGQSKTANLLFAVALDTRGQSEGVRAYSLHPGSAVTNLARYASEEQLKAIGVLDENSAPIIDPTKNLKTIEQGAATSVWCATSAALNGFGGVYCENSDIGPLVSKELEANRDDPSIRRTGSLALGVMPYAIDPEAAERLWSLSEQLVGVTVL